MHTVPIILTIITTACCMDMPCPGAPKTPRSITRTRFTSRKSPVLKHVQFIQSIEDHDSEAAMAWLDEGSIDPSFDDNLAIRVASENGLVGVVGRLLDDPRVDPSACNNYAIRNAGKLADKFVVRRSSKLLYSQGDVRAISSPTGKTFGFSPRICIMRLLMADPRVPFPSHLRKPSLNNPPIPLHLQINRSALETIKMNDLESYQTWIPSNVRTSAP